MSAQYIMRPSVFIKTTNPLCGLDAEKQLKKVFLTLVDMFIIMGLRRLVILMYNTWGPLLVTFTVELEVY